MVYISFEIGGEFVEPDNMKDVLDITFMKHIKERIENSLAGIRCPIHDRPPTIIVKGENLDNLHYEISGCCDELIKKARMVI